MTKDPHIYLCYKDEDGQLQAIPHDAAVQRVSLGMHKIMVDVDVVDGEKRYSFSVVDFGIQRRPAPKVAWALKEISETFAELKPVSLERLDCLLRTAAPGIQIAMDMRLKDSTPDAANVVITRLWPGDITNPRAGETLRRKPHVE